MYVSSNPDEQHPLILPDRVIDDGEFLSPVYCRGDLIERHAPITTERPVFFRIPPQFHAS